MPSIYQVVLVGVVHLATLSYSKPLWNGTVLSEPAVAKAPTAVQRGIDQVPLVHAGVCNTNAANVIAPPNQFIGWHGTNSRSADFWTTTGHVAMPPPPTRGCLDFIGQLCQTCFGCGTDDDETPGSTGANHELGPGFYITDDIFVAKVFANGNAQKNTGTNAMVCAIFADHQAWITNVGKALIPDTLVTDDNDATKAAQLETNRLNHIRAIIPTVADATTVVKFANLARPPRPLPHNAQMCAPNSVIGSLTVQCFPEADVSSDKLPGGTQNFPTFSYNNDVLRTTWNIVT